MGITERKTREKEERRTLILEKAKELILERGVPSLSMQDIADSAELSKATLYLYFQSKEAILAEILEVAADTFISYVESRIDPEASGIEALKALWESYLAIFGDSPDIFVLIGIRDYVGPGFSDGPESLFGGPQFNRKMTKLIADILSRGKADRTIDATVNTDRLAQTVMTLGTAIVDNVARLPREARDTRLISEEMRGICELLLRGLAREGTDRSLLVLSPE